MIKVVKFGGSSLADASQFQKAGRIIKKEDSRRYVVPSAPGKRTPDDTKVTDMLYGCYAAALTDEGDDFEDLTCGFRRSGSVTRKSWTVSEWGLI